MKEYYIIYDGFYIKIYHIEEDKLRLFDVIVDDDTLPALDIIRNHIKIKTSTTNFITLNLI